MTREILADLCYVSGVKGSRHRVPGLKHIEDLLLGHMTIDKQEYPWFESQILRKRQAHIERLAAKKRIYI